MIKLLAILTSLLQIFNATDTYVPEQYYPKASLVMELNSNEIIFQDNSDLIHEIASLTKLMTVYVALKEVDAGKVSLDTKFKTTQNIVDITYLPELSNNLMTLDKEYTLKELIELALLPSSNAAAIMIAESLYGNETAFVGKMNEYAQELGMTKTTFINSSGLENSVVSSITNNTLTGETTSTAYDLALLSKALVEKYPFIIDITKEPQLMVAENTLFPELINSSFAYFLSLNENNVGLKTGSGDKGGYTFVGLTQKNGKNYLTVVLGAGEYGSEGSVRYDIANALSEYATSTATTINVKDVGEYRIDNYDILLEQPFVVEAHNEDYTLTLENDELVYTQNGSFLNQDQRIIRQKVTILRTYDPSRKPFAYLGLELVLIVFVVINMRKRIYKKTHYN